MWFTLDKDICHLNMKGVLIIQTSVSDRNIKNIIKLQHWLPPTG